VVADVYDEYGEVFLDFGIGTQLLFGHRDPKIEERILVQMQHHTWQGDYGQYQDRLVSNFAEALSNRFPADQGTPKQVCFTSSTYEARLVAANLCYTDLSTPTGGAYFLTLLDREGNLREGGEVQDEVHKARAQGLKIVADEVDTGWGRTGTFCLYEQYFTQPDVVVLGSAGMAGLPGAAVVAGRHMFEGPGFAALPQHGIELKPNPLAAAAGTTILERLTPDLIKEVQSLGLILATDLRSVCEQFAHILTGSSGAGLVRTIKLAAPSRAAEFRVCCRRAGLLIQPNLRLAPPLTVTEKQVRGAVDAIAAACIEMDEIS
jgi:acetylornithine/succinyldiaminopimelate/putrescine aminotransferase